MHYYPDNYFSNVPVLLTLSIPSMFVHPYSFMVQYLDQCYTYSPNAAISNSLISLVADRLLEGPEKTMRSISTFLQLKAYPPFHN